MMYWEEERECYFVCVRLRTNREWMFVLGSLTSVVKNDSTATVRATFVRMSRTLLSRNS